MDFDKRKQQLLKKTYRILNGKKGEKICTFIELAKALKISIKTFRTYTLNNIPEIKELLDKHRHEIPYKKKSSKKRKKSPLKKSEKNGEIIDTKFSKDERLRSYEEIKAKLFGYKAFKQKNYERLTPNAKTLIDRQIWILEWVMKQDANKENTE